MNSLNSLTTFENPDIYYGCMKYIDLVFGSEKLLIENSIQYTITIYNIIRDVSEEKLPLEKTVKLTTEILKTLFERSGSIRCIKDLEAVELVEHMIPGLLRELYKRDNKVDKKRCC